MHPLGTLNDRVYFAYHCLPRNKRGKVELSARKIEEAHDLPQALLNKLFSGERKTVSSETAPKLATALRVSLMWLLEGDGDPPQLTGPIEPRKDKYGAHDPSYWLEKAHLDDGTVDMEKLSEVNNFFEAKRSRLVVNYASAATINEVREKHADKYPNGLTPLGWVEEFRRVQEEKKQKQSERREKRQPKATKEITRPHVVKTKAS
jgi:hypothetical protein